MSVQFNGLLNISNTPPADLQPWLSHQFSLTDKLKTQSGDATIKVLDQYWTPPDWWDRFVPGFTDNSVVHREILMFSHSFPCWYARTVIPDSTWQYRPELFDRLKHETLGKLIFGDSGIKRSSMLHYAIDSQCLEYYWLPQSVTEPSSEFWMRLSRFTLDDHVSFCLAEIFLPGLMTALKL